MHGLGIRCHLFIELSSLPIHGVFGTKKFTTIVCWTTILTILPIVGYVFYIVMGNGLSIRTRRMIRKHKLYYLDYNDEIKRILSMQDNLRSSLKMT